MPSRSPAVSYACALCIWALVGLVWYSKQSASQEITLDPFAIGASAAWFEFGNSRCKLSLTAQLRGVINRARDQDHNEFFEGYVAARRESQRPDPTITLRTLCLSIQDQANDLSRKFR